MYDKILYEWYDYIYVCTIQTPKGYGLRRFARKRARMEADNLSVLT